MILFFIVKKNNINKETIINFIVNYGLIISILIIFSFLTGWGGRTFKKEYGFGTTSWFIAGNDLGITMLLSLICCLYFLFFVNKKYKILKFLSIFIGTVLVGTRSAIAGSIIVILILLYYYSFIYKAKNKLIKSITIFSIIPFFIYSCILIGLTLYSQFDDYALNKFTLESVQSGRSYLIEPAVKHIKNFNSFEIFIGKGSSSLYNAVATQVFGDNDEQKTVEADIYETFGAYGFLLGIVTILPLYYFFIKSIKQFIHKMSLFNLCIFLMTSSYILIGFLGGHCLKNSMSAPIYAYFVSNLISLKNDL